MLPPKRPASQGRFRGRLAEVRRIITVDCRYFRPEFAASYLLADGEEAAFIDNNTTHALPLLLEALAREGLRPEQVRYAIITHVHLDHAGGSSALMTACPQAELLAHPKAAPHLIDPSRLIASARKVYGDAVFERLYGQIHPIDASRVRSLQDGEQVALGSGELTFLHTRGHANHHFCIHDPATRSIFTGDAFGLVLPALQRTGTFAFPSTSPTEFDPVEARGSIGRVLATGAARAFPTHFGEVRDLAGVATQLNAHLDFSEKLLAEMESGALSDAEVDAACEARTREHYWASLKARGIPVSSDVRELLEMDLRLNGAGIAHVAKKRRQARLYPKS